MAICTLTREYIFYTQLFLCTENNHPSILEVQLVDKFNILYYLIYHRNVTLVFSYCKHFIVWVFYTLSFRTHWICILCFPLKINLNLTRSNHTQRTMWKPVRCLEEKEKGILWSAVQHVPTSGQIAIAIELFEFLIFILLRQTRFKSIIWHKLCKICIF